MSNPTGSIKRLHHTGNESPGSSLASTTQELPGWGDIGTGSGGGSVQIQGLVHPGPKSDQEQTQALTGLLPLSQGGHARANATAP